MHITLPGKNGWIITQAYSPGMVSRLDNAVGRIVENLEQITYTQHGETRTLLQDTVIIFTSDNGGMSQGLGYGGASNYPLNGRKGDMYEGGCR